MKIIPGWRSSNHLARFGIFLIITALITGIPVSYGVAGDDNQPSQNLEIYTWYDLDAVRDNLDGDHILMNALNSTTPGYASLASPTANGGKGWEPIGYFTRVGGGCAPDGRSHYYLSGTFDGQGHEISDLFINRPDENDVSLFYAISDSGRIKNLGVTNVTITGASTVGGLVGSNYGRVINSYASGTLTGESWVGGLVGGSSGTVRNTYSSGNVNGGSLVGGLVGGMRGGSVNNSYSMCSVIGVDDVGGLVGASSGVVRNSYSTGSVTGDVNVGGLVGDNNAIVRNSYSTGSVTGDTRVGGLVGDNRATVSDSFWDTETSGQATSDGGAGKNTTEMKNITTFSEVDWNIIAAANTTMRDPAYIWNIVNNVTYPFLSWQPVS